MRRRTLLDSLGIFGSVVTAISFLERPFFQRNKIVLLVLGILTIGIYLKMSMEERAISRIRFVEKKLNSSVYKLNDRMNKQDNKVSKIKGWVEAINFFKDKKGDIDPIILITVLIIVIIIMLAMQGKI